jgi:signal transduction histidine kinase
MKVGDFIIRDFTVAEPYQGTSGFRKNLLADHPVVVKEEGHFLGILTSGDLVNRPRNLVIDCLSSKPSVDIDEEVFPVLLFMCQNNYEFLPVMKAGSFEGLISKNNLFLEFLKSESEHTTPIEETLELKKELALKNKFLSIIGHDIKNLFNQIMGSLELLDNNLHRLKDDKSQTVLRLARRATEQVNTAFEGMLLWARLGTGQLPFRPENLLLKDQIIKIVGQYQLAGNVKNITIRNLLTTDIEIYADRNMLNCILLNLFYNALKFTPVGGEIWVDAKQGASETEVVVADNGTGISWQQKKQLFTEGHATPGTLNEMGTGIGLIICKEFVEKHGGRIEVKSEQGKGTQVSVTFPFFNSIQPMLQKN